MKTSSLRHTLMLVAVCIVAVIAVFTVFGILLPPVATIRPAFAPTPIPPVLLTTGALYTPADHDRLMKIGTALQGKKPISDADLDWAIALLQRGPVIDSSSTRGSFTIMTMSQLGNHHSMTPAQSRKLAIAVLPYADDPPLSERAPVESDEMQIQSPAVSLQSVAVITLASLDDDSARAKLKSLARSSAAPKIQREAEGFLQRRRNQNAKPPEKTSGTQGTNSNID